MWKLPRSNALNDYLPDTSRIVREKWIASGETERFLPNLIGHGYDDCCALTAGTRGRRQEYHFYYVSLRFRRCTNMLILLCTWSHRLGTFSISVITCLVFWWVFLFCGLVLFQQFVTDERDAAGCHSFPVPSTCTGGMFLQEDDMSKCRKVKNSVYFKLYLTTTNLLAHITHVPSIDGSRHVLLLVHITNNPFI